MAGYAGYYQEISWPLGLMVRLFPDVEKPEMVL